MLLGGLRTEFNRKRAMKPEVPHGSHGFRLVPDGEFCHADLALLPAGQWVRRTNLPSATDFQFADAADFFTFLPLKVPQAVPARKTWRGL